LLGISQFLNLCNRVISYWKGVSLPFPEPTGQEDGKPKIFRDTAVENLKDFFDRFRLLNVRSNEQLDHLVEQAQRVIRGVEPQTLRENANLRQQVATQLSGVQSVLDGLLVDRPRRNILRRSAK
jgi:hypothetical protein